MQFQAGLKPLSAWRHPRSQLRNIYHIYGINNHIYMVAAQNMVADREAIDCLLDSSNQGELSQAVVGRCLQILSAAAISMLWWHWKTSFKV